MILDFVLWALATAFGIVVIGFSSLIVWGLWRELKKRK